MNLKEINKELSNDGISCKLCGKEFLFINKNKDTLIGFKSHLKQLHKISILDYFEYEIQNKCKFCKIEDVDFKISKIKGEILFNEKDLCSTRQCKDVRKKLNTNSIEYVKIVNDLDNDEEAKSIIHERNSSPFYKINFENENDYIKNQQTYSPLSKEFYKNSELTDEEISNKITVIQHHRSKKNNSHNRKILTTTLDLYVNHYGEELGTQNYNKWLTNIRAAFKLRQPADFKVVCALKWYMYVYGKEEGTKAYNHRISYVKWYGSYSYYGLLYKKFKDPKYYKLKKTSTKGRNGRFSSISVDFINTINDEFEYLLKCGDVYYTYDEFKIKCGDKFRYYDFTFISKDKKVKKIIEFNGDYWHCNPIKYKEHEFVSMKNTTIPVKNIWENDELKHNLANENGFDVMIVWEHDWNHNKNEVIFNIKNFLED